MKEFLKLMKALPDFKGVKMVKILLPKVMCVCEMKRTFQISLPTVFNNSKIREDPGMVDFDKYGSWSDSHFTDGRKSPHVATFLGNLRHWMEGDSAVKGIIQNIPHIHREALFKKLGGYFFAFYKFLYVNISIWNAPNDKGTLQNPYRCTHCHCGNGLRLAHGLSSIL